MNVLISSCLCGVNCRYNGGNNLISEYTHLKNTYNLIPVCPEVLGGLDTPREPCEIKYIDGKLHVVTKSGEDKTNEFIKGANETLKIAKEHNASLAILKANSPSCGHKFIYDGTFSNVLIEGNGVAASLLLENGIEVITEKEL